MRRLAIPLLLAAGCGGTASVPTPDASANPDASAPRDAAPLADASAAMDAAMIMDAASSPDAQPSADAEAPTPDAAVMVRGTYVDPTNGLDTNPGTMAAPFRTLTRASMEAQAGETIYLADGDYAPPGEAWDSCRVLRRGVSVRAINAGGARLRATTTNQCGLLVDDGAVDGIALEGFEVALQFRSGTSTVTDVRITDTSIGLMALGTSTVTVQGLSVSAYRLSAFGVAVALADDDARLTVRGGTYEGAGAGGAMILARGRSKLTIEGTTFRNNQRSAVRGYDDTDLILRDVLIEASSLPQRTLDATSIFIGPTNTTPALTPSLRMERTRILRSPGNGLSVTYYSGVDSQISVTLIDSAITDSTARGILIEGAPIVNAGLGLDIAIESSTISRNGGLELGIASLDLAGSVVRGNTVQIGSAARPTASLRVRGTTIDELRILAPLSCDLGTVAEAGGNTFTPTNVALQIDQMASCAAIGNTWLPNVQGADAQGRYNARTTVMGPVSGRNHTLAAGSRVDL